jgi:NTP pyrophosphatase (non-canonical NTP hydrolase)
MSNVPTFWQLNDYQQAALRTEREMEPRDRIGHGALGLAGEAGECADLLKKVVYFGHDLDRDKVRAELGDVLWYLAVLADACGLTLDEVAEANVAKLRKRYGDGFSEERSRGRLVAVESTMGSGPEWVRCVQSVTYAHDSKSSLTEGTVYRVVKTFYDPALPGYPWTVVNDLGEFHRVGPEHAEPCAAPSDLQGLAAREIATGVTHDGSAGYCSVCDGATARKVDGEWKCSRCSKDREIATEAAKAARSCRASIEFEVGERPRLVAQGTDEDLPMMDAMLRASGFTRAEPRDRRAQCAECGTTDGVCEHGAGFLCRGCLGAT